MAPWRIAAPTSRIFSVPWSAPTTWPTSMPAYSSPATATPQHDPEGDPLHRCRNSGRTENRRTGNSRPRLGSLQSWPWAAPAASWPSSRPEITVVTIKSATAERVRQRRMRNSSTTPGSFTERRGTDTRVATPSSRRAAFAKCDGPYLIVNGHPTGFNFRIRHDKAPPGKGVERKAVAAHGPVGIPSSPRESHHDTEARQVNAGQNDEPRDP